MPGDRRSVLVMHFKVQPVIVVVWLSIGLIVAKPTVAFSQPFQDRNAESPPAPGLDGTNDAHYTRVTGSRAGRVTAHTLGRADFELANWDVGLGAGILDGPVLSHAGGAADTRKGRLPMGYDYADGDTLHQYKPYLIVSPLQPGLNLIRTAPLPFLEEKTGVALPGICTGKIYSPGRRDCYRQVSTTTISNTGESIQGLPNGEAAPSADIGLGQIGSASGTLWAEPDGVPPGSGSFSALQYAYQFSGNGVIHVSGNRLSASGSAVTSEAGDAPVGPEEVVALEVECDDIPNSVYTASGGLQLSCRATGATGANPDYQWAWTARGGTTDTDNLSATDIPNPVFQTPKFLPITPRNLGSFTYEYTAAASVAGEGTASAEVDITVRVTNGAVSLICSRSSATVYEGMPDIEIGCGWFSFTHLGVPESFNWEWTARAPTTSVDELSDPHIQLPTFYVPESVDADTEYSYTITVSYPRWNGEEGDFTVTVRNREDYKELLVYPTRLEIEEGDTDGETYGVVLTSQPAGDVTVIVSDHATTDVSVSPSTLTFTTDSWSEEKTVTVTAVQDDDVNNDYVTLTNTASGGGYDGADAVDVVVTVIDNKGNSD